jgi:hypothetical protein
MVPLSLFVPGEHSVKVKEKEAGGEEGVRGRDDCSSAGCASIGDKSLDASLEVEGREEDGETTSGVGVIVIGGRGPPCSEAGHVPPVSPCAIWACTAFSPTTIV